ncbi:hypothetical protein, partial [Bacillus sp. MUM 13]|uniref:hypothetical protein n=1 Tax=Bacillus sp. MUM 13 TaxID=1678001 RepID=UPI00196B7626
MYVLPVFINELFFLATFIKYEFKGRGHEGAFSGRGVLIFDPLNRGFRFLFNPAAAPSLTKTLPQDAAFLVFDPLNQALSL